MVARQVHFGSPWLSGLVCRNCSKVKVIGLDRESRFIVSAGSMVSVDSVVVHEMFLEASTAMKTWGTAHKECVRVHIHLEGTMSDDLLPRFLRLYNSEKWFREVCAARSILRHVS